MIILSNFIGNFWKCCFFWQAYDISLSLAKNRCGDDSVDGAIRTFEILFPDARSECPGYGSMTCTQWFMIPLFFAFLGIFFILFLISWATIYTIKYYRQVNKEQALLFDKEIPTIINNNTEKRNLLKFSTDVSVNKH